MKNYETGTLDLGRNLLFGFEDDVYDTIIYSIYRGIASGSPIRPVPVVERAGRYLLTFMPDSHDKSGMIGEGGHHRAYTHYRLGIPLPVIFLPRKYAPTCGMDIRLLELKEDTDNLVYKERLKHGKKYAPLDGFERPMDLERLAEELRCQRQL